MNFEFDELTEYPIEKYINYRYITLNTLGADNADEIPTAICVYGYNDDSEGWHDFTEINLNYPMQNSQFPQTISLQLNGN